MLYLRKELFSREVEDADNVDCKRRLYRKETLNSYRAFLAAANRPLKG